MDLYSHVMGNGDFPVDKVFYAYNLMYNGFKRLSKDYSATERTAMLHNTATRVYRIEG